MSPIRSLSGGAGALPCRGGLGVSPPLPYYSLSGLGSIPIPLPGGTTLEEVSGDGHASRYQVVDGDGHIFEDHEGILAHMTSPYREIAQRRGNLLPPLDHLHDGRAVETPPMRDRRPRVGPEGWLAFLDDVGIDWTVLYPTIALAYGKIVSLDYAVDVTPRLQRLAAPDLPAVQPALQGHGDHPAAGPRGSGQGATARRDRAGHAGRDDASNGAARPLGAKHYWPVYAEAERLGCAWPSTAAATTASGMDHLNMYVPVHALGHPWGLADQLREHRLQRHLRPLPRAPPRLPGGRHRLAAAVPGAVPLVPRDALPAHPGHQFGPREGERPDKYIIKPHQGGRFYVGCETEELTMPFALKVIGNEPFSTRPTSRTR